MAEEFARKAYLKKVGSASSGGGDVASFRDKMGTSMEKIGSYMANTGELDADKEKNRAKECEKVLVRIEESSDSLCRN